MKTTKVVLQKENKKLQRENRLLLHDLNKSSNKVREFDSTKQQLDEAVNRNAQLRVIISESGLILSNLELAKTSLSNCIDVIQRHISRLSGQVDVNPKGE